MWSLAFTTAVIAVIATATVQLIKDLSPARRWFQQYFLNKWFLSRFDQRKQAPATELNWHNAKRDLVHLATGGDFQAFYNLEPAQLCGQMNSAAQVALAYASRHRDLLRFLAPEADPSDIEKVASAPESPSAEVDDVSAGQSRVDTLLDARNRLAHHLQRTIDALQISMSFRWKLILQIVAYLISFTAAFMIVFAVNAAGRYDFITALTIGIVAGFLSPAVSDLLAVINRLRKP
jgi:hypothetical protein